MHTPIDYDLYVKDREDLEDYFRQDFELFRLGLSDENLTRFLLSDQSDSGYKKVECLSELDRLTKEFPNDENFKKWQNFITDLFIDSGKRLIQKVRSKTKILKDTKDLNGLRIWHKKVNAEFEYHTLTDRYDMDAGQQTFSKFVFEGEEYVIPRHTMKKINEEFVKAIEYVESNIEIERLNNPTSGKDTVETNHENILDEDNISVDNTINTILVLMDKLGMIEALRKHTEDNKTKRAYLLSHITGKNENSLRVALNGWYSANSEHHPFKNQPVEKANEILLKSGIVRK